VRDGRPVASDSNDGRDRTGPSELGSLAGPDGEDGRVVPDDPLGLSGPLGVDFVVSDRGASLLAPPSFRSLDPCRLMLSRNHMARFPEKCESRLDRGSPIGFPGPHPPG
jgi:hypothetical protein